MHTQSWLAETPESLFANFKQTWEVIISKRSIKVSKKAVTSRRKIYCLRGKRLQIKLYRSSKNLRSTSMLITNILKELFITLLAELFITSLLHPRFVLQKQNKAKEISNTPFWNCENAHVVPQQYCSVQQQCQLQRYSTQRHSADEKCDHLISWWAGQQACTLELARTASSLSFR